MSNDASLLAITLFCGSNDKEITFPTDVCNNYSAEILILLEKVVKMLTIIFPKTGDRLPRPA